MLELLFDHLSSLDLPQLHHPMKQCQCGGVELCYKIIQSFLRDENETGSAHRTAVDGTQSGSGTVTTNHTVAPTRTVPAATNKHVEYAVATLCNLACVDDAGDHFAKCEFTSALLKVCKKCTEVRALKLFRGCSQSIVI